MYTGQNNTQSALPLIKSKAYKELSNEKKIIELKSLLRTNMHDGRERALLRVQGDSDSAGEPFSRGEKFEFERIPKDIRRLIESDYLRESGQSIMDSGGYRRGLEMYDDFKREKGQLYGEQERKSRDYLRGRTPRGLMTDPYMRGRDKN